MGRGIGEKLLLLKGIMNGLIIILLGKIQHKVSGGVQIIE